MLSMKITYVVELSPQEFRLVSAALRGEIKDEWKKDALALQDRLFKERNRAVQNQLNNIASLEKT